MSKMFEEIIPCYHLHPDDVAYYHKDSEGRESVEWPYVSPPFTTREWATVLLEEP